MKAKSIPSKFFFAFRRVLIKESQAGVLKICIRRKDKAVYSKDYQFSANTLEVALGQKLQFPTTVEQDADGYKSKTATLQVLFTLSDGSTDQASAELELTEFVGLTETLTRSTKLRGQNHNAHLDYQCNSTLGAVIANQFKSVANIQAHAEIASRGDLGGQPGKSTKQLGLHVRKKQKTLLLIPEADVSAAAPNLRSSAAIQPAQFKRNPKRFHTNIQFSVAKAEQYTLEDTVEESHNDIVAERVGCAPSSKSIKDRKEFASVGNFKSSTSLEGNIEDPKLEDSSKQAIRKLNDQVKQLQKNNKNFEEENKKLLKANRYFAEKIKHLETYSQNTQDSRNKIVQRLHSDIDSKNKQIKQLEQELETQRNHLKQQQELTLNTRRELKDTISQKDRIMLDNKLKGSNVSTPKDNSKSLQREMDQLRKDYEQKVKELKDQNARLLAYSQPQDKSDICLSRQCDSQKKQFKAKIKQIQKALDEKEAQLQTKERLIKNYEAAKKDRQYDSAGIDLNKQMQKWRCQRMLLQQQIDDLKNSKSEKCKGQDQMLTLKVQKQTMSRQCERLNRTIKQLSKDKETFENSSQKLQEQLINSKQKVVDLLNGIYQHGGMELYDTICNIIE